MADLLRIFSGPAQQVSLYDATNGLLHLGYALEDINAFEESLKTGISDGNQVKISKLATIEIPLAQTDSAFLTSLLTRLSYLQEVYIIGYEMVVKMTNVFLTLQPSRGFKGGDIHQFMLTGTKAVDSDFHSLVNLLDTYGNMDTDTNSDGVANGWTSNAKSGSEALATSFVNAWKGGDHGNHQEFDFDAGGQNFYCQIRLPLNENSPIKFGVRGYVRAMPGSTSYFKFGIKTLNSTDTVVDTDLQAYSFGAGTNNDVSRNITLTPGADIQSVAIWFEEDTGNGNATLAIDEMQLELGDASPYTEGS